MNKEQLQTHREEVATQQQTLMQLLSESEKLDPEGNKWTNQEVTAMLMTLLVLVSMTPDIYEIEDSRETLYSLPTGAVVRDKLGEVLERTGDIESTWFATGTDTLTETQEILMPVTVLWLPPMEGSL